MAVSFFVGSLADNDGANRTSQKALRAEAAGRGDLVLLEVLYTPK